MPDTSWHWRPTLFPTFSDLSVMTCLSPGNLQVTFEIRVVFTCWEEVVREGCLPNCFLPGVRYRVTQAPSSGGAERVLIRVRVCVCPADSCTWYCHTWNNVKPITPWGHPHSDFNYSSSSSASLLGLFSCFVFFSELYFVEQFWFYSKT